MVVGAGHISVMKKHQSNLKQPLYKTLEVARDLSTEHHVYLECMHMRVATPSGHLPSQSTTAPSHII